jgi:hypothetical protein
MIIESLSNSFTTDFSNSIDITIKAWGSVQEFNDLCKKYHCNKEVSIVDKEHNDEVDALCYLQTIKPNKDTSPIKKVIFNDPATIVLWKDGTKTVVKCQKGDTYDKEKGFYMCVAKKALGNRGNFNNEFKKWL